MNWKLSEERQRAVNECCEDILNRGLDAEDTPLEPSMSEIITDLAERIGQSARDDRDMDWWRELGGIDSVAPTPKEVKKLVLSELEQAFEAGSAATRERDRKALCPSCAENVPMDMARVGGKHWHVGNRYCYASAIRQLSPATEATSAPPPRDAALRVQPDEREEEAGR